MISKRDSRAMRRLRETDYERLAQLKKAINDPSYFDNILAGIAGRMSVVMK